MWACRAISHSKTEAKLCSQEFQQGDTLVSKIFVAILEIQHPDLSLICS